MGSFKDGRYDGDTVDQILGAMIADAKEYWGTDIKEGQLAIIRQFYRPIAEFMAEFQADLETVLRSTHIDRAEGTSLDLLTALIGVSRDPATKADGTVTFSRDNTAGQDYTIPQGTAVQTNSSEPTKYETTEAVTLSSGSTSVDAPITAVENGVGGNTGTNTITVMPSPPAGIDDVTNQAEIYGGSKNESDDELRKRAKEELATGSRASASALINSVQTLEGVTSTSIFLNDTNTDNTGSGGLPDHSFEIVANGGNKTEIGQSILDTKAAGDTAYGGANGNSVTVTADLPNGQTHDITFSRPVAVQIYVDISLDVTDEFAGKDEIRDRIVEYIGGLFTSGQETVGDLGVGDDVIFGEIRYAIRDVEGVYDITSLTIGTSSSPTGTSNITISDAEVSESDATDGSMTISTTQV